jgi:hypothetical protein
MGRPRTEARLGQTVAKHMVRRNRASKIVTIFERLSNAFFVVPFFRKSSVLCRLVLQPFWHPIQGRNRCPRKNPFRGSSIRHTNVAFALLTALQCRVLAAYRDGMVHRVSAECCSASC